MRWLRNARPVAPDFSAEMVRGIAVGDRMKHRVCRISIALVVILPVALAGRAIADDSPNAQEFLELLRAHDARFDNCSVQFTRREPRHVDERIEFMAAQFNNFKYGRPQLEPPAEFPDPYDATLVHNGQLTIRDDDFMLSTVWLTDRRGHPQPPAGPIHWGRADGIERSLDLNHRVMHIDEPAADECSLLQWKRMACVMSLGVGYSQWLREISELQETDAGWRVSGSMNLFGVDRTQCELEIDADLIVRKANVYCIVGPEAGPTRERRFEICNSGVLEDSAGPLLAQSGSFQETTVVAVVGGESQQVNRPGEAWEIKAGPVEFDLSDETYSELTSIDEESADHVIDRRRK